MFWSRDGVLEWVVILVVYVNDVSAIIHDSNTSGNRSLQEKTFNPETIARIYFTQIP